MSLFKITLDDGNRHTFAPGDRVSGLVTYQVKPGVKEIRDLRIAFVGSITTQITSSEVPRSLSIGDWKGVTESQPIFRSEQSLIKGSRPVAPEVLSFQFEFQLPKKYSPTRPDDLATTFVSPYIQQPLPLSLKSGSQGRQSSANISYILQATVVGGKSKRAELTELAVNVGSFASAPLPKPQVYRFKFPLATWNSFRANTSKLSLRQKLSHIAHLDSPSIALDGGLHIPEELSASQKINIRFSAKQIRTKESDPVYPHLRLKRVVLALYGFTEVLGWYPDHPKGPQSVRCMHKDEVASRTYVDVGPHDGTILKLDGSSTTIAPDWSLNDFTSKAGTVPDFTSALTLHRHSIMAQIDLFHEESSHIMKLNVEVPVKILPSYTPEHDATLLRKPAPQPRPKPQPARQQPSPQPARQQRYSYASSEGRYSAELPAYSANPEQPTFVSAKGTGSPPAYAELEGSIPPQSELPRILRVVNGSG